MKIELQNHLIFFYSLYLYTLYVYKFYTLHNHSGQRANPIGWVLNNSRPIGPTMNRSRSANIFTRLYHCPPRSYKPSVFSPSIHFVRLAFFGVGCRAKKLRGRDRREAKKQRELVNASDREDVSNTRVFLIRERVNDLLDPREHYSQTRRSNRWNEGMVPIILWYDTYPTRNVVYKSGVGMRARLAALR